MTSKSNLAVLVLEKAKKKFGGEDSSSPRKVALSEASKKLMSAMKSDDHDGFGTALGEFLDIHSDKSS